MSWKEFLVILQGIAEPIHDAPLAAKLGRTRGEIGTRLDRLRSYGYLKYADVTRKAKGGYVLTTRGRAFG